MATLARHSLFTPSLAGERKQGHSAHLVAIATLTLIFAITTIDAIVAGRAPFDLWLLQKIQAIDLHGFDRVLSLVEHLTGSQGAIAMWTLSMLFFLAIRSWGAVVAVFLIPIGGLLNETVGKLLVDRERPHVDSLVRTSSNWEERSFPSGHVMGAVLLYGLLFVIARKIANRALRLTVQITTVAILLGASFQRLWDGAHWPSDVIGAYSLGGLILIALAEIYDRVDRATAGMPFFSSRREPHNWAQPHAHALTSRVSFEGAHVVKSYSPGFVPAALYWSAFQAPFPYVRNLAALRAAMHRRNLAAQLSEYWPDSPKVARIESISQAGSHPAIVSERIYGSAPTDRSAAKRALKSMKHHFEEAGLPTWQIDPIQPRAIDNLLQTPDGTYHVVDLESGLVAPFASLKSWVRAIRRGLVPFFDDVYFDITRAYVKREEFGMRLAFGSEWYDRLTQTLDRAERETAAWHRSEPRIINRLVRAAVGVISVRQWPGWIRSKTAGAQQWANNWLEGGILAWERDARLTADQATELRAQLAEPEFQEASRYLGAQALLGIPLRFPVGSIVRVVMVSAAWSSATIRYTRRSIDREAWRRARRIHSLPVLLIAALPGVGGFAYLASKPMRSNHLMLRVALDAILLRFLKRRYEQSSLRRRIALPVGEPSQEAIGEVVPLNSPTSIGGVESHAA